MRSREIVDYMVVKVDDPCFVISRLRLTLSLRAISSPPRQKCARRKIVGVYALLFFIEKTDDKNKKYLHISNRIRGILCRPTIVARNSQKVNPHSSTSINHPLAPYPWITFTESPFKSRLIDQVRTSHRITRTR